MGWIGGWKLTSLSTYADVDGWSYASTPNSLLNSRLCYDNPGVLLDLEGYIRPFRRRIWKRHRVLISYPGASEMSMKYLSLRRKISFLELTVSKLSCLVLD